MGLRINDRTPYAVVLQGAEMKDVLSGLRIMRGAARRTLASNKRKHWDGKMSSHDLRALNLAADARLAAIERTIRRIQIQIKEAADG